MHTGRNQLPILIISKIKCSYCNLSCLRLASRAFNPRQEQFISAKKQKLPPRQLSVVTFQFSKVSTKTQTIFFLRFHLSEFSASAIWALVGWAFQSANLTCTLPLAVFIRDAFCPALSTLEPTTKNFSTILATSDSKCQD